MFSVCIRILWQLQITLKCHATNLEENMIYIFFNKSLYVNKENETFIVDLFDKL